MMSASSVFSVRRGRSRILCSNSDMSVTENNVITITLVVLIFYPDVNHKTKVKKNHSLLDPDENEFSLYMITTCLNIQVTRIKEVITEDRMS